MTRVYKAIPPTTGDITSLQAQITALQGVDVTEQASITSNGATIATQATQLATLTTTVNGKTSKSSFSMADLAAHGVSAAPADATTNYNVVTTLLGSLTGAVNTANTKQNDIATRLNAVMTWLDTNKDKINALIAAGKL